MRRIGSTAWWATPCGPGECGLTHMSREYGFVSTTLSLSCATFWRWEPSGGPASVADIRLPRQRPPARACVEQYDLAAAPVTWTELPPARARLKPTAEPRPGRNRLPCDGVHTRCSARARGEHAQHPAADAAPRPADVDR